MPLSFHGDGVPVLKVGKSGSQSADVYSHQGILCKCSSSELSKILITILFTANRSDDTETEIWRILLWSLHFLYLGKWPTVNWNQQKWPEGSPEEALAGKDLAGGLCGILYTIKGDLDFYAKVLGLRHYNANEPCELCPAHRHPRDRSRLYNNFPTMLCG